MAMKTKTLLVVGVAAMLSGAAACAKEAAPAAAVSAESASVKLSPDNVATATLTELRSGPAVSGQLTPAREATMRAQVGGSILSLTVDKGQPVTAGQVIAKIGARDLEDAFQ